MSDPIFKGGNIYRLKDTTNYDDDHGQGYDCVETFSPEDGYFVRDCWIVNEQGEVHPGYDAEPVPVRFCDVEPDPIGPAKNTDKDRAGMGWR